MFEKQVVFLTIDEINFSKMKNILKKHNIPFETGTFQDREKNYYISVSPFKYKKALLLVQEFRKNNY